ncbi:MAG: glycosyltransferase family 1 protein, partial [Gammaproteobacteria bacterium]|nr:glycosyltransferase family 1 protein [Gammaproteobacteria bacterium]
MKFLLIASFPDSLITFRGHLIDTLLARGMTVHVAAPNLLPETGIYKSLDKKGVNIHNIPLRRTGINPFKDMFLLYFLCRLMLIIRPQMLLSYTIKPVIYGSLAARIMKVPYRYALITGLGYAFTGKVHGFRKFLSVIIRQLYRLSLYGVDNVFFQNEDDQKLFNDLGILSSKKQSVVINGSGVDVVTFSQAP